MNLESCCLHCESGGRKYTAAYNAAIIYWGEIFFKGLSTGRRGRGEAALGSIYFEGAALPSAIQNAGSLRVRLRRTKKSRF